MLLTALKSYHEAVQLNSLILTDTKATDIYSRNCSFYRFLGRPSAFPCHIYIVWLYQIACAMAISFLLQRNEVKTTLSPFSCKGLKVLCFFVLMYFYAAILSRILKFLSPPRLDVFCSGMYPHNYLCVPVSRRNGQLCNCSYQVKPHLLSGWIPPFLLSNIFF